MKTQYGTMAAYVSRATVKLCVAALVALFIALLLIGNALADEIFDYSNNGDDYGKKVAEMCASVDNGGFGANSADSVFRSASKSYVVLFRTENTDIPFETAPFNAYIVAYGPNGFATLVCDDQTEAIEWLTAQDGVLYAEENKDVTATEYDDELISAASVAFNSYGATQHAFGDYIKYVKNRGSGTVTVAVIDSGVNRHTFILPRITRLGYDYVDNDSDPTNDGKGHGTHVAGIVADCTRELPIYIYPIRVLDNDGNGSAANVISAINEAVRNSADVINLSLSAKGSSQSLEDTIRNAIEAGVTVVVSAGNNSQDASNETPARMTESGIIVVGSVNRDGTKSSFSNFGNSVDVYAYGSGINSCLGTDSYTLMSGTSMAAPHMSAFSAMIKYVNHSLSPAEVEGIVKGSVPEDSTIPTALSLIPYTEYSFCLSDITLWEGDTLRLPTLAIPVALGIDITYSPDDADIAYVDDGLLTAVSEGMTTLTAECAGHDDMTINVTVLSGSSGTVTLPSGTITISDEAFMNLSGANVVIPDSVITIGKDAFGGGVIGTVSIPTSVDQIDENDFSGAVILCDEDSVILEYARENGLQYIINEE